MFMLCNALKTLILDVYKRQQQPSIRNKNFSEVATGYTKEMAVEEAKRCLNCKHKPCVTGCPVSVRIPEFIKAVAQEDFALAYKIIKSTNSLPAVCGRVCPQETQCESNCVRGINCLLYTSITVWGLGYKWEE